MLLFLALVFAAVALLALGLMVPTVSDSARARRRLKARLHEIEESAEPSARASLLRARYLQNLTPLEQRLEQLPGIESVERLVEQSGHAFLAYRVVAVAFGMAAGLAFASWTLGRTWPAAVAGGFAGFALPFVVLAIDRKRRLDRFEEQLPEAIDVISRALRAGHPFASALGLVANDMDDPVACEFRRTFADVNYGTDVRRALLALLARTPSLALMAFVTAVLVQRETGGNLAEILDQIAHVIRSRFRFQRRVRTLSAEGRLSAWILALVPLAMFGAIWLTTRNYLSVLMQTELGRQLLFTGVGLAIVGVLWIRRVIRIEV
jgi:tight adherence protein B